MPLKTFIPTISFLLLLATLIGLAFAAPHSPAPSTELTANDLASLQARQQICAVERKPCHLKCEKIAKSLDWCECHYWCNGGYDWKARTRQYGPSGRMLAALRECKRVEWTITMYKGLCVQFPFTYVKTSVFNPLNLTTTITTNTHQRETAMYLPPIFLSTLLSTAMASSAVTLTVSNDVKALEARGSNVPCPRRKACHANCTLYAMVLNMCECNSECREGVLREELGLDEGR
ncbi:hypothetical protein IQ07DRAFT_597716 [Pyrenochaeta sp. DS3sAY3a]|nr:hypothetical protein IQ07DRAFT_597716 [Pyrenochaeta sp. DS3sAY3a]